MNKQHCNSEPDILPDCSVAHYDFSINRDPDIRVVYIGNEQQPVIIVDNLMNYPERMLDYAESETAFKVASADYYPGIRKVIPVSYADDLADISCYTINKVFNLAPGLSPQVGICALSITTTKPEKLLPIQSVPHFDTSDANEFAIIHYLCSPEHGGTAFYRHRQTGYEAINTQRLKKYTKTLEREATTVGLPKPHYINSDSLLFKQIASFDAKFNRALIYRSNVLHSGNIQAHMGLSAQPRKGRLTAITSLIFT